MHTPAQIQLQTVKMVETEPESDVPKSTSAVAWPPASPAYPRHRIAPTLGLALSAVRSTDDPVTSTVIGALAAAATAATREPWAPGSPISPVMAR